MTTGIVICNLYRRINKPSVNAEKAEYYKSGDEVKIKNVVTGDGFEGVNTWYELENGIYVWSGGVSLNLENPLFVKKLELDKQPLLPGVLNPYDPKDYWWINDYGIDKIWKKGITGKRVKIAVLDQGVQISHNDLKINKDNFIDIVKYPDNTNAFVDYSDHGTHIYGLIAASDNGFGITGISFDSELFFANIFDFSIGYSHQNLARAINWAVEKEVDIISISQGSDKECDELFKSIEKAVKKNILVVCASGNLSNSFKSVLFPAQYCEDLEIFSVGAIDKGKNKYVGTMESGTISIYCPGVDILSCDKDLNIRYSTKSGSSQAAPFFASVAALGLAYVRSRGKSATGLEIGKRILEFSETRVFGKIIDPLNLIEKL